MGYIGSSLAAVNSGRSAESRRERLATEKELREKEFAPVKAATERLARSKGAELAEIKNLAILQLREKLISTPSPDFQTPLYSGGASSAAEVTQLITNAVTEWCQTGDPLPSFDDSKLVSAFVAMNWESCDSTKVGTFQKAWEYILGKFAELDKQFEAPVEAPIAEVPAGPFAEHDALLVSLQAELDALPVGNSRARENLERRLHKEQVTRELLGEQSSREILGEIATQSGLVIPSTVSLQFANWLGSPVAKRRFGADKTSVRRAFAEFTGNDSFLTPEEKQQVSVDRANDQCLSDAVKQAVGFRNDYGTRTVPGIRQ